MRSLLLTATALLLILNIAHAQDLRRVSTADDYYRSGAAHIRAEQFDLALADLNKALELNPKHVDALFNRILALNRLNLENESRVDWDRFIELAPKHRNATLVYLSRANYRVRVEQYDAAIDDLNKLLALKADDPTAYWLRSLAYLMKGEINLSSADYKKSLELNPDSQPPFVVRAYVFKLKRHFKGSLEDYTKSLEWKPDDGIVYVDRGTAYVLTGDITNGLADIRRGWKLGPESVAERAIGGYRCPFCSLNIYVQRLPGDARVYEARGILRLLQRRDADASAEFETATRLAPALKTEIEGIIREVRGWK